MNKLEVDLIRQKFHVVNETYPSRDFPIKVLAKTAIDFALPKCPKNMRVNFVTHSLGGILLRQYLSLYDIPDLHRVVMLAPPNKGSEVVDTLKNVVGFHFFYGDAGLQLGTGEMSVPNRLGAANFDVGIIAGNKSINWMLSTMIPGVDDGKVSVGSTRLEGLGDHIDMPVTHSFMMKNSAVFGQAVYYLKNGKFDRS
jgi:hypothetical protein